MACSGVLDLFSVDGPDDRLSPDDRMRFDLHVAED